MSHTPSEHAEGVPFSFLCSLFREISQISPQSAASRSHELHNKPSHPALKIFKRWTIQLHNLFDPLPPRTTAILFKLLFPEDDTHRKYDMQEARLAHYLADCMGMDPRRFQRFETTSGSLGEEVKIALQRTYAETEGNISPLSISQVDALLDELASISGFSHKSIRNAYPKHVRRERLPLLRALFRPLSPVDASFLTQIILKDLRPVLYPVHVHHYSSALLDFDATSVHMLTKEHAMKIWDPTYWMLNAYRVRATIDETAASFELPPHQRETNVPRIGIPVQIPKSEKGRNCTHVLEFLKGSKKAWVETKYDGERAQIHVEVLPDFTSKITIFSKSRRDSTLDRHAIHEIIRNALGLSGLPPLSRAKIKRNIILDAEMVACDGTRIDEFWRIRGLVEKSAHGIRRRQQLHPESLQTSNSQSSVAADISENHHLALVFFDILLLDERCLLSSPYSQRRSLLESIILLSPGESMIAERTFIALEVDHDDKRAQQALEKVFAAAVADHQEGLVIKAEESRYHDHKMPWVKLKKDYIPGHGDAVDLVIIGATWDRMRARELRVPPSTLTTLYIGVLSNSKDIENDPNCKPHFQVYFTVSYGLTRSRLEEINFLIKNSDPTPCRKSEPTKPLPYNFTLLRGLQPPSWLLKTPLLAELFGAGFTKSPHSNDYELRFPRLTKIHRPVERSWKEAATLEELQKIARDSVGLVKLDKDIDEWSRKLWGRDVSDPPSKRKAASEPWEENSSLCHDPKRQKPYIVPAARSRESDTNASPCRERMEPLATNTNVSNGGNSTHTNVSCIHPLHITDSSMLCPTPQDMILPPSKLRSRPSRSPYKLQVADEKHISPNNMYTHRVLESSSKRLFLENALIWLAKPRKGDGAHHASYRSWGRIFPAKQRIHSVESLLSGCGWSKGNLGSSWVERGVIFLDDSTIQGKKWREHIFEEIEQRRKILPNEQTRKPIWMFDVKTWSLSIEDPIKAALCLLD